MSGFDLNSFGGGTGVAIRIGSYTASTKTVTGRAPAGFTVTVLKDGVAAGTTVADSSGNWSYVFATDPDGAVITAQIPATSKPLVTGRSLPALPFATGARVVGIGDSQIGYSNSFGAPASATGTSSTGYGFIEQASAHDQRFRFDCWYDPTEANGQSRAGANHGLFSDHLDWTNSGFGGGIVGRLPAVLARRPDILIIEGGVNTIATGDDGREGNADYVISKLDAMLKLARFAGVWVILMTIYPRGDWLTSNLPKAAILEQVNTWIRAQSGREGILDILDGESLLRPGGTIDATMFKSDQIHLSPKGALAFGRQKLLPILQAAISAGSTFNKDQSVSNLLSTGLQNLAGTTGTQSGWPVTGTTPNQSFSGQLATGLTLTKGRNCSVVASKEIISGSLEQQVLAITPGGGESGAYFDLTLSGFIATETHTVGQWYQFFMEAELLGDGPTFWSMVGGHRTSGNAVITNPSVLVREASGDYTLGSGGGARTFWFQSEPFRLPDGAATTDKIALSTTVTGDKAGAPFTLKLRKPIIRRVTDPRSAWGYPAT